MASTWVSGTWQCSPMAGWSPIRPRSCRHNVDCAAWTGSLPAVVGLELPTAPGGPHQRLAADATATCQEHARVANVRHNSLHHLTSELVDTYSIIVVERLNVAGLLRNRRLARRLADASLGKLRRQLAYKTAWAGTTLVEAGPFYPSSKTCCGCGHVKAKLPLSEREYRCEHCGMVLDRDLNAARNLAMLVNSSRSEVAGSGPETPTTPVDGDARPCTAGSSSMKREAGTEPLGSGQTGTAGW